MLILTRSTKKPETKIYHNGVPIGRVVLVHASRGLVRLGFELPPEYRIVREEIEGQEDKEAAA